MRIEEHFPLRDYNSFGIDVCARAFVSLSDSRDLGAALELARAYSGEALVLGGGSNILFTRNYSGIVLHLDFKGITVLEESDTDVLVEIAAGENWHHFVQLAVQRNWHGVENLALIPGSAGAAPIQNIGAYGVELADVFHSARGMMRQSGRDRTFYRKECRFAYRNSIFKQELKGRFIISHIRLRLKKEAPLNTAYGSLEQELAAIPPARRSIRDVYKAVCRIRRSKLPDPAELGNAGSFFKNPVLSAGRFEEIRAEFPAVPGFAQEGDTYKIPAAWLIEECGWKGRRFGNAGCYQRQALVLVNLGNAEGIEVLNLALAIQQSVLERFGIELTPEVNIV